jgi:hypothetical protein
MIRPLSRWRPDHRAFGAPTEWTVTIALAAVACIAAGSSLQAKQASLSGLDKLHEQARVGGKTCMTEHEHGGEGTLPSKKGARQAAIRHWQSFTTWEYGRAWGRYRLAAARKMDCQAGGSGWLCKTTARPCRR